MFIILIILIIIVILNSLIILIIFIVFINYFKLELTIFHVIHLISNGLIRLFQKNQKITSE